MFSFGVPTLISFRLSPTSLTKTNDNAVDIRTSRHFLETHWLDGKLFFVVRTGKKNYKPLGVDKAGMNFSF